MSAIKLGTVLLGKWASVILDGIRPCYPQCSSAPPSKTMEDVTKEEIYWLKKCMRINMGSYNWTDEKLVGCKDVTGSIIYIYIDLDIKQRVVEVGGYRSGLKVHSNMVSMSDRDAVTPTGLRLKK